jgi:hypothetical protein
MRRYGLSGGRPLLPVALAGTAALGAALLMYLIS